MSQNECINCAIDVDDQTVVKPLAEAFPISVGLGPWLETELNERGRPTFLICISHHDVQSAQWMRYSAWSKEAVRALRTGRLYGVRLRTCNNVEPGTIRIHTCRPDKYEEVHNAQHRDEDSAGVQ